MVDVKQQQGDDVKDLNINVKSVLLNTYPVITDTFLEAVFVTSSIVHILKPFIAEEQPNDLQQVHNELSPNLSLYEYLNAYKKIFPNSTPSAYISELTTVLNKHKLLYDKQRQNSVASALSTDPGSQAILMPNTTYHLLVALIRYLQNLSKISIHRVTSTSLKSILTEICDSPSHPLTKLYEQLQVAYSTYASIEKQFSIVNTRLRYNYLIPVLDQITATVTNTVVPLDEFLDAIEQSVQDYSRRVVKLNITRSNISTFSLNEFENLDIDVVSQQLLPYVQLLVNTTYIATPFPKMTKFMRGGFAPTRLYVAGGPSGSGKSSLLLHAAMTYVTNAMNDLTDPNKPGTVLFITIENLMHETLSRIASWVHKKDILDDIYSRYKDKIRAANRDGSTSDLYRLEEKQKKDLSGMLADAIVYLKQACLRNLEIRYIAPSRTCLSDIQAEIDQVANACANNNTPLEFVVIDFINPIASYNDSGSGGQKRHELGKIARFFKDLAIDYRVPVLTAAHLNRTAYDVNTPLTPASMGESIQIVENADSVILLRVVGKSPQVDLLQLGVGKLRYGGDGLFTVIHKRGTYHMEQVNDTAQLFSQYNIKMIPSTQQQPQQGGTFTPNQQQWQAPSTTNNTISQSPSSALDDVF